MQTRRHDLHASEPDTCCFDCHSCMCSQRQLPDVPPRADPARNPRSLTICPAKISLLSPDPPAGRLRHLRKFAHPRLNSAHPIRQWTAGTGNVLTAIAMGFVNARANNYSVTIVEPFEHAPRHGLVFRVRVAAAQLPFVDSCHGTTTIACAARIASPVASSTQPLLCAAPAEAERLRVLQALLRSGIAPGA